MESFEGYVSKYKKKEAKEYMKNTISMKISVSFIYVCVYIHKNEKRWVFPEKTL